MGGLFLLDKVVKLVGWCYQRGLPRLVLMDTKIRQYKLGGLLASPKTGLAWPQVYHPSIPFSSYTFQGQTPPVAWLHGSSSILHYTVQCHHHLSLIFKAPHYNLTFPNQLTKNTPPCYLSLSKFFPRVDQEPRLYSVQGPTLNLKRVRED